MKFDIRPKRSYDSTMSKVKIHRHPMYIPEPLYKRLKHLSQLRIASINAMAVEGLYLIAAKKEAQYNLKAVTK